MSGERVERRLAAILAADIAGYSRLMGRDETGTLERIRSLRHELIDPKIAEHKGRVVKTTGDGILIEFPSIVEAVACAVAVQKGAAEGNSSITEDQRIEFRVGINLGDLIVEDGDIYGDGVNVAARLEALAEPGGICVSAAVHDQVRGRVDCGFEDLGEQSLKNIARPVRVYRVHSDHGAVPAAALAPTPALHRKPSIAVLALENLSDDPEQEYFADGISEDVITLLSKSRSLFVISRNSTFTYKGRTINVKTIGRERAGNRVRVTAQLIEAATAGHLWAERYDRDLTDIFAVQDEITSGVSAAILPTVERSERERAARKPPESLDAWECYHRGLWHFSKFEPVDNKLAIDFFERAIVLDPGFAAAHGALAEAYLTEFNLFRAQSEREILVPRATEHAQQSIVLDPAEARGHAALSHCLLRIGRHAEAMAEADLAVSLDPNSAMANFAQGVALVFDGRPANGIAPLQLPIRLSPVDPGIAHFRNVLSRAYYWMGDYQARRRGGRPTVPDASELPIHLPHANRGVGSVG